MFAALVGGAAQCREGDSLPALRELDAVAAAAEPLWYRRPAAYLGLLPGAMASLVLVIGRRPGKSGAILLLLPLLLGLTEGEEGLVRAGLALYRAGDPSGAADAFGHAERVTGPNAALAFNRGICLYASGQNGSAITALLRGAMLDPGQKDYHRALETVEEGLGLRNQVRLAAALHPNGPFVLTIACANLALVAAGLLARRKSGVWFIATALAVIFTVASAWLLAGAVARRATPLAVVSVATDLKRIPLPEARAWIRLPEGTSLRVRGSTGGFRLVETALGMEGWVEDGALLSPALDL